MTENTRYDVVILGGGLAGLTLARQLKRARPSMSILVAERQQHPVPEAAHKVGESTVEVGAHYLSHVLDLKDHLETEQIRKFGLRYFFPFGDNRDIARRVEFGAREYPPLRAYQIDRGRFENALWSMNRVDGVRLLDACKVEQVSLGADEHTVRLRREGRDLNLTARWIVDASGRAGLLKRQLGLAQTVGHDANAAWFRLGEMIDVADWSDDPAWHARVPSRRRWQSTNHLMGRGYWVWLIPLASGSISVGIVADAALHPFEQFNRFDRALAWLREHEPQCAEAIEAKRDRLQDFRVMKRYAYGCKQVFSADRWCLTGEAGVFIDPYYSPGTDFIGYSNTFITDLILRDLDGETIAGRLQIYNEAYLNLTQINFQLFEGQYPLMGNAQVMLAKTIWDLLGYWGILLPLQYYNKFTDANFIFSVLPRLRRQDQLVQRVQAFFREWDELDRRSWADAFIDPIGMSFLASRLSSLDPDLDDDGVRALLFQNMDLCESVAAEMFRKAARLLPGFSEDEPIDPLTMSLKERRWRPADGALAAPEGGPAVATELKQIWLDEAGARLVAAETESVGPARGGVLIGAAVPVEDGRAPARPLEPGRVSQRSGGLR